MKNFVLLSAVGALLPFGSLLADVPVVLPDSVRYVQGPSRVVSVDYTLSNACGVVTVDILTNGVSIGAANLTNMVGDVNKIVQVGDRHITWLPYEGCAEHRRYTNVTVAVTAWATNAPPDYMVVDLRTEKSPLRFYATADAIPGGVTDTVYKTDFLVMRKIHAANVRWRMGAPTWESSYRKSWETIHSVTLSNDYYMGVYHVTQRQYERVIGSKCGSWQDDDKPVNCMSWNALRGSSSDWPDGGHEVESASVIGKFRDYADIAFDLPTSAQWEFACRAGTTSGFNDGRGIEESETGENAHLNDISWYKGNSGTVTHAVGLKAPNAYGLYDMHGNAWQPCLDWFEDPVADTDAFEPTGPRTGTERVRRGGTYNSMPCWYRSAYSASVKPGTSENFQGFRLWAPALAR